MFGCIVTTGDRDVAKRIAAAVSLAGAVVDIFLAFPSIFERAIGVASAGCGITFLTFFDDAVAAGAFGCRRAAAVFGCDGASVGCCVIVAALCFGVLNNFAAIAVLEFASCRAAIVICSIAVVTFFAISADSVTTCCSDAALAGFGADIAAFDLTMMTAVTCDIVAIIACFEIILNDAVSIHIRDGDACFVLGCAVVSGTIRRAWRNAESADESVLCDASKAHGGHHAVVTFLAAIHLCIAACFCGAYAERAIAVRAFPAIFDDALVVASIAVSLVAIVTFFVSRLQLSIAACGNTGFGTIGIASVIASSAPHMDIDAFVAFLGSIDDAVTANGIPRT